MPDKKAERPEGQMRRILPLSDTYFFNKATSL